MKISNTVELGHPRMGVLKGTNHKNMLQIHEQRQRHLKDVAVLAFIKTGMLSSFNDLKIMIDYNYYY